MNGIGQIQLVFLFLLLFIVVFGLLARRLGTPYPIVMVVGGLLLGLVQNAIRPGMRQIFVVGWTGMRGVVSLAAALALPALLADGSPFPQRNLIVFLAFCAICVTLVLQGVTLPPLIRALGLGGAAGPKREEQEARRIVIEAVVSHLEHARHKDRKESASLYDDLTQQYHRRLASLQPGDGNREDVADRARFLQLFLDALRVERKTAIGLRDDGRINDDVLRGIERELDLAESRLMLAN